MTIPVVFAGESHCSNIDDMDTITMMIVTYIISMPAFTMQSWPALCKKDTYLGSKSDPLSLNLYAYCKNEPINYYDPTGHTEVSVTLPNGSKTTGTVGSDGKTYVNGVRVPAGSTVTFSDERSYYAASDGIGIRRNDGTYGNTKYTDTVYSQDQTRKLIEAILATGNVEYIFFNDPVLINEFKEVTAWPRHDDHLHVRYK